METVRYKVRRKRMYLSQIKGLFVYRRAVEFELAETYKRFTGKTGAVFKRSLGTRDKKEAEKRLLEAEKD